MAPSETRASQIRDVRELVAHHFGDARADDLTRGLAAFSTLVREWNARGNLVSSRDAEKLLSRHIPESVEIAAVVSALAPRSILDLGSGAGFPGIPVALTSPGSRVVLLESRRMKSLFLLRAIRELGLASCFAWCARAEIIGSSVRRVLPDRDDERARGDDESGHEGECGSGTQGGSGSERGTDTKSGRGAVTEIPVAWSRLSLEAPPVIDPFDVVTARAVAPLVALARLAGPIVGSGGRLIATKGSRLEEEMREWEGSPGPWRLDSVVALKSGWAKLVILRRT